MKSEIATIHERMSQGGDWRTFQQEIAALHAEATTEEEYTTLLDAHQILVACAAEAFDPETHEKILPVARAEYLMFLNKEAMEDGLINPVLLDRITRREVEAGRLDPNDDFRQLAQAGGSVLGDSAELTAHRCKQGDWLCYGMAGGAILAFLANLVDISPLWIILPAFLIGWYFNDRERVKIKGEIAARRAQVA